MKSDSEKERRPYVKPEMRRVELKPEESLSAGCKMVGTGGPVSNCDTGGQCFNFGS